MACVNGVCGINRPKPAPPIINKGVPMAKPKVAPAASKIIEEEITSPKKSIGKKIKEAFVGKKASILQVPTGTPGQEDARRQLLEKVLGPLLGQAGKGPKGQPLAPGNKDYKSAIDQILKGLTTQQKQTNPTLGVNPQTQQLLNQSVQQQQQPLQSIVGNPESQQLLQQTLQGSKTPQGYDFAPIEQRANQQFQQQTIPTLAERFTSMGGQSKQGSSAFTGALGQAGADLQSQLAALRSQYGIQERQQLGQEQGQRQGLLGGLLNYGQGQQQLGLQQAGQGQNLLSGLLGYGLQGQGQNTRQNLAQQGLLGTLLSGRAQQQGLGLQQQGLNNSQESQYQNLLLSLLGQGTQSPFNPIYQPATGGLLGGLANIGGQAAAGLGRAAGAYAFGG